MSDIVERLRFTAEAGVPDFTNSKLLDEAADEIERLRASLKETLEDYYGTEYYDQNIVDRAKAALGKLDV